MTKIIIAIFLLVWKYQGVFSQKFPPENCDSLVEYQFLRKQYEGYIGKTIADVYANDTFAISGCYNVYSSNTYTIRYKGINHIYGDITFELKSNKIAHKKDFYNDVACAEIYRIMILMYMYNEKLEYDPLKCVMYITK